MQTSLIPLYWDKSEDIGKIIVDAKGIVNNQEYIVKIITVDPFAMYKPEKTANILSNHLKKYSLEYIQKIVPILANPQGFSKHLTYILIVQVQNPDDEAKSPVNSNLVANSAIRALNLCSSFGVLSNNRFLLPNIERPGELARATTRGGVISFSANDQGLVRIYPDTTMHHYQISNNWVDMERFQELVEFFNDLQTIEQDNRFNFHKLSELVSDLFETIFAVRNYRPKFLLLTVIYETIFKHESDRIKEISEKISKFVAEDAFEENKLRNYFHNNDPSILTVGRLRNGIAHGDLDIERDVVKEYYKELHEIIRRVLIRYFIEYSKITHSKHYFSQLQSFINKRWKEIE